ncbi:hypothetical protein G5B38_03325 [Pseudohalocynthiibacter aestuariivivens]|nr:hypothetical protein [Pseudohalocynthiibacter aestuariivivens]QIE44639.1 hypothetical protein G5B38_03325 [Pseudohalocynthiibacter aestuariivivens]
MSSSENKKRLARIVEAAEAHFGAKVDRATAPGGEGRSSFRLYMGDRAIIATLRPNFRRTHLEAYVLQSLQPHCDDIPECLGVVDEVMFQSDVGRKRLNRDIVRHDEARQLDLSAEAISAIFRIQNAARKTTLHEMMPHLGTNREWIENFVYAVNAMEPYGNVSRYFNRDAACEAVAQAGVQFVKWDCRSGNAAIAEDGKLRWFDFEYSGLRHGAEDVAWLIGDEAWPLSAEKMVDVVIDCFDPDCGHTLEAYLEYLSIYMTFHCIQRFKLIVKEAKSRGWLTKEKVRKYDDAGVHPDFAAHICRVGGYFAAQTKLTDPLVHNFEKAAATFDEIALEDPLRKSA